MLLRRGTAFGRFRVAGLGRGTGADVCNLVIVDTSTNYAAAPCEFVRVDASGGARTVTPPSSPAEGCMFAVAKVDASINRVIVDVDDGTWLLAEDDGVAYRWDGAAWSIVVLDQTPQLQQLTSGVWAAWSLDQQNGTTKVDRSGNGRDADGQLASFPVRIASQRPKHRAFAMDGAAQTGPVLAPASLTAASFQASGFSFAFWYCWMGINPQFSPQSWLLCWSSDASSWIPLYYPIGPASAPGGRLSYWDGVSVDTQTNLYLDQTFGKWQFLSVSWSPSKQLIVGLDDTFETFTGIEGNAPPAQYPFSIGGPAFPSSFRRYCTGAFDDMVVWNRPLSVAEFRAQRKSTGIPL